MKKHVWAVCLGVAAVLAGAAALATGTGEAESPTEEPDDAVVLAEEDWAAYEGVRDAVAAMTDTAGRTPTPQMRTTPTNGLRFTAHEWTTNGTFRLELAYETDTDVEIFAYAVAHTSAWVVATWTNDENHVVTDTNLVWTSVGLPTAIDSAMPQSRGRSASRPRPGPGRP